MSDEDELLEGARQLKTLTSKKVVRLLLSPIVLCLDVQSCILLYICASKMEPLSTQWLNNSYVRDSIVADGGHSILGEALNV